MATITLKIQLNNHLPANETVGSFVDALFNNDQICESRSQYKWYSYLNNQITYIFNILYRKRKI